MAFRKMPMPGGTVWTAVLVAMTIAAGWATVVPEVIRPLLPSWPIAIGLVVLVRIPTVPILPTLPSPLLRNGVRVRAFYNPSIHSSSVQMDPWIDGQVVYTISTSRAPCSCNASMVTGESKGEFRCRVSGGWAIYFYFYYRFFILFTTKFFYS